MLSFLLAVFVLFMQRRWREPGQRAIVLAHDSVDGLRKPLTLVVIDPDRPRLTLMPLPPEQGIEPLLNYGNHQTQALIGLTLMEKLRWEFALNSLSLQYGVALDGIIWTKATEVKSKGALLRIALGALLRRSPTTLTLWDRGKLLVLLQSIPEYQVDQSFPAAAGEEELDKWAGRAVQDTQIRSSGLTVAIQNASGVQGLAARLARMLRLMGYDVRAIDTIPEQTDSRLVFRPELDRGASGHWAKLRLLAAAGYLTPQTDTSLPDKLRADLVVVIGTDLRAKLSLRQ